MASLELGRWYVVQAKHRQEQIAQFYLERKGLIVFFPRLLLPQPVSKSKRPRIVPLFPNYFFVRIRKSVEYNWVRWSPGVVRIVDFNEHPAPLDDRVVEFLRRQATSVGVITRGSALADRQEEEDLGKRTASLMKALLNPCDSRDRVRMLMQFLSH